MKATGRPPGAAHPAVEFLRVLFDGLDGVIELRPLPTIERCFARPGEVPTLLDFIARYPTNLARRGDPEGREHDRHPGRLPSAQRGLHRHRLQDDPAPEARRLLAEFPIPPSIVVGSGHGLHVYWLFREPFTLPADEPRARHLLTPGRAPQGEKERRGVCPHPPGAGHDQPQAGGRPRRARGPGAVRARPALQPLGAGGVAPAAPRARRPVRAFRRRTSPSRRASDTASSTPSRGP